MCGTGTEEREISGTNRKYRNRFKYKGIYDMIKSKLQISAGKLFNIKLLGKQGRLSGKKKFINTTYFTVR